MNCPTQLKTSSGPLRYWPRAVTSLSVLGIGRNEMIGFWPFMTLAFATVNAVISVWHFVNDRYDRASFHIGVCTFLYLVAWNW